MIEIRRYIFLGLIYGILLTWNSTIGNCMDKEEKVLHGKILVTGASGNLGKKTLEHLLEKVPANRLVGLARDPMKVSDLAEKGIEIRKGDYFNFPSLLKAFEDIEKVMLISAPAFTDRNTQHYNAITAARQAGVKYVAFMSIIRKEGLDFIMPEVTVSDIFAEQTLKASGLSHTIFFHPPFMEIMPVYIGENAQKVGVRMPAGSEKVAAATRDDLAEAQAVVLATTGHENKNYTLSGSEALSYAEMANVLSKISGQSVPYVEISEKEWVQDRVDQGVPQFLGEFLLAWVIAGNRGVFSDTPGDLERLIGHKPQGYEEFFKNKYSVVTVETK